ncbi:hypothetical protein CBER1_10397 [Cercospora berteroae]|uniref:DUF7730 domain-containing protein n=1 Tax=Cercospora berteroae TaxID=357750 RepID=A0A2S6BX22_9PEZI|nr:hypothetical protein CBER1_10397 [Cercospora berteroae]
MVKISLAAARVYLRHRLEPERSGTFDFMGLPAELREKIYKMMLVYPKRGLSVRSSYRGVLKGLVLTPGRPGLQIDDFETITKHERELICLPKMCEVLSILQVSKQLYLEALPIFYRNNLFHFSSLRVLEKAMDFMGREVKKMIDHMQIDSESICHYEASFRRDCGLATLFPDLAPKTLVLEWPEQGFRMICPCDDPTFVKGRTSFKKNAGLADFVALAQRAEKLDLRGNDKFKTWLERKLADSMKLITSGEGNVKSSKEAVREP